MTDREWMMAQQERVRKGKSWEKRKKREKKGKKWFEGKEHLFAFFFVHNQICGLLSAYQPTACQPHNLRRERWGLSRYGLKPGRVD